MIEKILAALKENNIDKYFVTETVREEAQLYFIKKRLDLTRSADLRDYTVRVYKDFTKDDKSLTGSAEIKIELGETDESLRSKIKGAYEACEYAGNPSYSFKEGIKDKRVMDGRGLDKIPLNEAAMKFAAALFSADKADDPIINSAEFFVTKKDVRIIGSNGCDVSYTVYSASGEFVAQCKKKTDVEMFHQFAYDGLDCDDLAEKAKEALETIVSRSIADQTTPKGVRSVILSDKCVEEVFSYYAERAHAAYIYPGYSNFKAGADVMGETEGDRLTMSFIAKEPFSDEGIPMTDRPLLDNGVFKTVHGGTRLCSYLNAEPTGTYRALSVNTGSLSFEDMKQDGVLYPVSFSDFQMDALSGHFGGEIRLAYLYKDGNAVPVTGGSINGNFIELQKNIRLSSEKQISSVFSGPKYILLHNVAVNGI